MRVLLLAAEEERRSELVSVLEEGRFEVEAADPDAPTGGDEVALVVVAGDDAERAAEVVARFRLEAPTVSVVALLSQPLEGSSLRRLGRTGAYDCLVASSPEELRDQLPRLEAAAARSAHRQRSHPIGEKLLGKTDAMAQVRRYLHHAATSPANVLLLGETGTGKELAARAIHEESDQSAGPFVAVNCAALPETLLESELFGHERGAFTGAERRRRGAFEAAHGGTLFLDEIGETTPAFQAKLLRVLQPAPDASVLARDFQRVGGEQALRTEVRIIAATNIDLGEAVRSGVFREDLLERLRVIAIRLPPLRERLADLPLLTRHFLDRFCRREDRPPLDVDPHVMEVLRAHPWPGNVRELEGLLRSIATLKVAGDAVVLGDLPPKMFEDAGPDEAASPLLSLAEVERDHIERVLRSTGGNKSKAARILGIARPTLDRKIDRHDIQF